MSIKKTILPLIMVLLLVFATSAFADANIIIGAGDEHQYDIYQIYTGEPTTGSKILSNLKYGQNHSLVVAGTQKTSDDVTTDELDALEVLNSASEIDKITAIKNIVSLSSTARVQGAKRGSSNSLPTGYYLVVDKGTDGNGAVPEGSSLGFYFTTILNEDIEVTPKRDSVTSEKFIKDINDSTDTVYEDWDKTADHDIGDDIPFKLTANLPGNYNMYTKYYLQFHDQMDKGLTFKPETVTVYVDGQKLEHTSTNYTVITSGLTDGCTFGIVFEDLKTAAPKAGNHSVISVEYEATLNNNAQIGAAGNHNKSQIEYSNNPNNVQDGDHGRTPWDDVVAYTFKLVINKVGEDGKTPLAGADFTLEKQPANSSTYSPVPGTVIKTVTDESIFTFTGLDAGNYRLVESKTPNGYNTIKPIEFQIIATHGKGGTLKLDALSGNTTAGIATFSADTNTGTVSTTVVNHLGSTLPETGGIGTTILYVAGGALVLLAVIMLVAKRRENMKD